MTVTKKPATKWWEQYNDYIPDGYSQLIAAEDSAKEIRAFSSYRISGLLQTEAYAIATFTALFPVEDFSEEEAKKRIELRMLRQRKVLDKPNPPLTRYILDETLLYRQLGGPELLREQLLHLVRLSAQPHIEIRILPLAYPVEYLFYNLYGFNLVVLEGSFSPDVLYQEHSSEASSYYECSRDKFKIMHYNMLFNHLWQKSQSHEESIASIKKAERSLI